jgi:hypothetical protein
MIRWIALTAAGLFALYGAWHLHVTPLAPDAPERTGWLFQQFGNQGVTLGMLLMAIVFIVIGVVGTARWVCRLGPFRRAHPLAASPQPAVQRPPVDRKSVDQGGIRSALAGLFLLIAGGGIAYVGLYLPFLAGRPHDMKASFGVTMAIGYGLALLTLGPNFGPTMYRRRDGAYIPTLIGAATLIVLLGLGLALDRWFTNGLHAPH